MYTRHLDKLINSARSFNYWVTLTQEALNELLFWKGLPRGRFEGDIWPAPEGISNRMASDANKIG
jgi:hypothetical protein